MKNTLLLAILTLVAVLPLSAQKYISKTAHISFSGETPAEKIEAHNRQVNAALDSKSGDMVVKVLLQSFQFERALMQEHFNENYVESHRYPNSTFVGKVHDIEAIDFSKNGTYAITVSGSLSLHGVSKNIVTEGKIEVNEGNVRATASFPITVADYNIKVPSAVMGKIAEKMEVSVEATLEKFTK